MSDAGTKLDPIEAARYDVARSRKIVASVADDLHEYNRWFESYLAEEQKKREQHARWVKHQQAVLRRREWRHRTMRSMRRALIISALAVRSAVLLLLNAFVSALVGARDAIVGALLWTAGTARRLALKAYQAIAGGLAFATAKSVALGAAIGAAVSAGAIWIAGTTRFVATAGYARAAAGLSWSRAKARSLGLAGAGAISAAASRTSRAVREAASAASTRITAGLSWSATQGRALALTCTHAVTAGVALGAGKAQAALSAMSRHITAGSAWAGALGLAAGAAASAGASWSAARTQNSVACIHRGLASSLSWCGEKARAFALIGAAAILTCVSAVTWATETVTFATAEMLAAGADRLRTGAVALAASLQSLALAWRNAIAARLDVLVPKLLDTFATASSSMRATTLRFGNAAAAKVAAAKPTFQNYALRASTLAAGLRRQVKGGLYRLSRAVIVPLEGIVLSAPGSLRPQHAMPESAGPSPSGPRAGNGADHQAAATRYEEPERGKALICIEPWRCQLPALPPKRGGRQVLALN